MDALPQLGIGVLASSLIGGLGYWRRSLTWSGWLGAILVGSATFGLGGAVWGGLIIVFFVTSSLLSRLGRARKAVITANTVEKGDQRDLWQALANGGIPALAALGHFWWPHPWWWALALGALGCATADTWATEIGMLSSRPPRHILTGQPIQEGMSGGVTALGLAATAAGGALIGGCGWLGHRLELAATPAAAWMFWAGFLGGCAGSICDSLLGAVLQESRWCARCQQPTERHIHRCGTPTQLHHGFTWLNNDRVNALSTAVGGLVGVLSWLGLG